MDVKTVKCPVCTRDLIPLFTSVVCDYCDSDGPTDVDKGFVVFQPERLGVGNPFYVFRSATDAAIWRSSMGLQHCELRTVHSEENFLWTKRTVSQGEITIADHPFELFPDHRFEPGPHRAFVAPEHRRAAA